MEHLKNTIFIMKWKKKEAIWSLIKEKEKLTETLHLTMEITKKSN